MDKENNMAEKTEAESVETAAEQTPVTPQTEAPQAEESAQAETKSPADEAAEKLAAAEAKAAQEHDNYLRLAAEYDNFRKRSQKEKDNLYTAIRAETVEKFLPVFDNLERALAQETADEAYKKGVEMTMTQLSEVMAKLGVETFGAAGDAFDPTLHNAVMHVEDEALSESTVKDVFQKGFRVGEKVIRFAMVTVAN